MATKKESKLKRVGRPSMNLKRRCIGLTVEDYNWLKAFGLGCISAGIRQAVKTLRKENRTP